MADDYDIEPVTPEDIQLNSLICEQVVREQTLTGNSDNIESGELTYIVIGTDDIDLGKQAVLRKAPAYYLDCPLHKVSVDHLEGLSVIYYRVTYQGANMGGGALSLKRPTISFDMSQSSAVVKRAYAQTKYGTNAPDPGLAIGWNGKYGDQLEIAGVSVPVCTIRKKYTKLFRTHDLSVDWERLQAGAFGRVNAKPFGDYQPGEMLFLGCSYSGMNNRTRTVAVEFNFAIAFNESNRDMGNDSAGKPIKISKTGWAYIWEIVKAKAEEEGSLPKLVIDGVYVANVYKTCDYKIFGLDDLVE